MKMITVADAAELLGVSTRRVQRLIQVGLLPATRVTSRMYLLDPKDVEVARKTRNKKSGRPKKEH
jgi:excisionase family DNA binding protein